MRNEMGNNNVVARPKEEDSTRIEDPKNPHIEEKNEIYSKEENRVVSEDNTKDFREHVEGSSSDIAYRSEDPRESKKMLDLTEDDESKVGLELSFNSGAIPTIDDNNQGSMKQAREDIELYNAISKTKEHENGEARVENDESPSIQPEEKQLLLEMVVAEDTELLGDKMDEKQENAKRLVRDNDSENKDIDLSGDKTYEKMKNRKCSVHDTDSEVIETISENEENNVSLGNGIEDGDIEENEIQIEDNNNNSANMIEERLGLEEISIITPEIETVATKFTATVEEERKIETELPIDECREIDSENKELQTLDSTIGVSKILETETISGRVSTGSIQEKRSFNPELRKSPSFVFDLPLESKFSESDQTPLLFLNKAMCRSISSPRSQPISVEEKTIQVERSDSDNLNGSFLNLLNDKEKDNFSKQDFETGSKENALTKGSGKRKPRPSMFTTCICCAAAIS